MYYGTVIHIFFYEGKDDFQKECVIMVTKRFQRKEEKMKRISSLLLMCLCVLHLCVCSVSAENVANIKEEESIFMPANGITQSEIVKQIQQYSKAGEKYSFTYKFKNYVKAKVSFAAKKTKKISVKLSTTSSGGAKNIFYRIYKNKNLSSVYLKQLKFPTDQQVIKSTTLEKGSYTFHVSRNPKKYSDKNKDVVGSGYMIVE